MNQKWNFIISNSSKRSNWRQTKKNLNSLPALNSLKIFDDFENFDRIFIFIPRLPFLDIQRRDKRTASMRVDARFYWSWFGNVRDPEICEVLKFQNLGPYRTSLKQRATNNVSRGAPRHLARTEIVISSSTVLRQLFNRLSLQLLAKLQLPCNWWSFFETRDAIQKFELLKIWTLINWNKRLNDSKINLEK